MNGVATFRLCSLNDDELIAAVDSATDDMFASGKIPSRHIPAQPNKDYDLIVGEMIYRFDESRKEAAKLRDLLKDLYKAANPTFHDDDPAAVRLSPEWNERIREALGEDKEG